MTVMPSPAPALRDATEDETAPWDRLPSETARAFAAFVAYRDQGPRRSLRTLAETYDGGAKVSQLAKWSRVHDWVERTRAWDGHMDREQRLEQVESRKRMLRNHAAVASVGIAKAAERIRQLDPQHLSAREAIALFETCVKVERLARGESNEGMDLEAARGTRRVSGARLLAVLRQNPRLVEFADAVADVVDLRVVAEDG